MYARTWGETTRGINGEMVTVEVDVTNGMPAFEMVGLPDVAVKEARERVKAAVKNSGFRFPDTHITVNLAPADLKKDGAGLDLPIAMGVLAAKQYVTLPDPMPVFAREEGIPAIFIPSGNRAEGELVDGIAVYTADDLGQIVDHFQGRQLLQPLAKKALELERPQEELVDFADVQGQKVAKRALEIAAAGGHNVLMVGAPGAGKTMLARRLPTILPPMTEEEALEVTKIYSISGLLQSHHGIMAERPFRSPHHTVSQSALIGGGSIPRPGEVTLSHHGVLFLDELPEFSRSALEVLRQPLEDGMVTISRVQASLTYPARFILVAAQNPCPCGFWGEEDQLHQCTCRPGDIARYQKKISGPLLDRIDIQIHVPRLQYQEMKSRKRGESSAAIRQRVVAARQIQRERLKGTHLFCNASMGRREVKAYCPLSPQAEALLERYFISLGLSARSHDRIIKVARTIADLAGSREITSLHLGEAIQLRTSIQG